MIIPLILILASIFVLYMNYQNTGEFINKGVSLKGGVQVTVFTDENIEIAPFQEYLTGIFPDKDISVRALSRAGKQIGYIVTGDISVNDNEQIDALISEMSKFTKTKLTKDDYNIEFIGSSLGQSFFLQTLKALIMAFMFMGAVVFYYFAENKKAKFIVISLTLLDSIFVFKYFLTNIPMTIVSGVIALFLLVVFLKESPPSFAVILSIVSDLIVTIAIVDLLGMKISTAGIAALLMLVGYSVDTDILLSTRMLKRYQNDHFAGFVSALKTGLLTTLTTVTAVTVAIVLTESETLKQIMTIVLIGLLVDIVNTWIQNAGLLRWYLEIKERRLKHD